MTEIINHPKCFLDQANNTIQNILMEEVEGDVSQINKEFSKMIEDDREISLLLQTWIESAFITPATKKYLEKLLLTGVKYDWERW